MPYSKGSLYLVSVPIGNLEDITVRAQRLLGDVATIACEDTRRTSKLLKLLGVQYQNLVSVYEHNEQRRIPDLVKSLEEGHNVALVSDAGTPTISDPGYRFVRAAIEADIPVVTIPGPCAAISALSISGLPTDQFRFLGFPPHRGTALVRFLENQTGAVETLIYYVGPHHLERFLEAAVQVLGPDRPAAICRELTKKFEEVRRGSLAELFDDPGVVRGEIVVVVGGASDDEQPSQENLEETVKRLLGEGYSTARAAKEAARRTGASRDEAYRIAVELRSSD